MSKKPLTQGITFISDQPSETDHLDFTPYVSALVDFITSPKTKTPLTLGIFGTWGSGKTTLMQLMEKDIKGRSSDGKSPPFKSLWINVWQISQQEGGKKAFLQALFTRVHKSLPFRTRIRFDFKLLRERLDLIALIRQLFTNGYRILIVIAPLLLGKLLPDDSNSVTATFRDSWVGGMMTLFLGFWLVIKPLAEAAKEKVSLDMKKLFKEAPYEIQVSAIQKLQDHFEHLVKAWVGKEGRLVVFVDDLDRCPQEDVIEALETLKLFATTEGCVYVLSADHEIVVRTVHAKYKDFPGASGEGIRYLEKIVQVPFTLPIIEITDIRKYVQAFNVDWPHEGCVDIFVEGLPSNPRQIKRAINVFFLLWQLAQHRQDRLSGDVTHLRLAKIVALQTVYPEVFEKLRNAPSFLKEMESHCLKSSDEQDLAIKNNLLHPILHDAVKIPTLQKLFTIHKDDPIATFSRLEPYDLTIFFSLTRSVQLSDTTVKDKVSASSRDIGSGDVADSALITGDVNVIAFPSFGVSSLHQLPAPPRDFTGREEELKTILTNITKGVTVIGISGLGGVGKTALALKLAEHLSERYPDAQFYLDLRGTSPQPMLQSEAMAHVIRSYHPTARMPENETELSALYHSVLSNQQALLLLDNAAGPEQIEPLLPPASCLLIITSRSHFTLPGMYGRRLDALPPEDARDLLLKIEPRIGELADELARLCGYLPLALRLAASALAVRKDWNPSDYANRLKDAKTRFELMDSSLSLSYELLSSEIQEKCLALAVFPDTFDDKAVAFVWETEIAKAQEAMSELIAYSLIGWDEAASRYRMHPLVRLFADARLNEDDRAAIKKRHAVYFKSVLASADDLYLQGGDSLTRGLALFDLEWGNIEEGHSWAEMNAQQDDDAARLCVEYPIAGAYVFELRLHPREQIKWLEASVAAARRLKDRVSESVSLGNLGLAYADLGETRKAIEYYEQTLTITRETGERMREGSALGNLGLAYADLGEARKAIEYYEQQMAITREIGDRRGEGNALGNLGNAYAALGEARKAIEFYEQRLVIAREIGDRRSEGNALGNLGAAYADLGETHKASGLYELYLTIAREIGDRRGEGNALFNMSLSLDKLGERARAIECAEAALKIYEEIESPSAERAREWLAKLRNEKDQTTPEL